MRQVVQNVKNGQLEVREVPPPALLAGGVLVRTAASIISPGTEKMVLELGKKSLIGKARERPDLVRQVLKRARTYGVTATVQNIMSKLDQALRLGYSAAGVVEEVAADVSDVKVGDRVAIAGAGYASHAEINFVPRNLTALMPDNVSFEQAAYTTIAAIAMQGIRLARPELGEIVAVSGLGLIGLITVQLLKASGCRVIGLDINKEKVELAKACGLDEGVVLDVDDPHRAIDRFSNGRGVDLTLITAATTSNQPIELAGEITRRKGRIVAVGAVGLNIPRDIYYLKELELKISMSYGPGRYDRSYEEGGLDYPYDYVRWTEQRNLESALDLMDRGRLNVQSLTTHRFPIEKAAEAYSMIYAGTEPYVGVVLEYDLDRPQQRVIEVAASQRHQTTNQIGVGFVGAGNYASAQLLPHLKSNKDARLVGLASATGLNAKQKAERFGFNYCATEIKPLLDDKTIDALFIASRHSAHAALTIQGLEAGKHVFVEKPMGLDAAEAESAVRACAQHRVTLAVGYNWRFQPALNEVRRMLEDGRLGKLLHIEGNFCGPSAYRFAREHWRQDRDEVPAGGMTGRGVHVVDAMLYLAGHIGSVFAQSDRRVHDYGVDDATSMLFRFRSGATGYLGTVIATAETWRLQIFGSKGWVELGDVEHLHTWGLKQGLIDFSDPMKKQPPEVRTFPKTRTERAELEHFARAAAERRPIAVPGGDEAHNVAVLEAIVRSARDGQRITLP
jgi:predicted dehydrogenase/threonine dehydrogenase-like Zn-dependent dehydrogenase